MARFDYTDAAKSVLPGMRTEFMRAYDAATTEWTKIAQKVPSTQKIETYPRIVGTGGPHEWTDERIPGGGKELYFQVTNKDYAVEIRVSRDMLRYNNYGQINMLTASKGAQMASYIDQLTYELLAAAATTATYIGDDDTYIVDTAHEEGNSGSQSNKGTTALGHDSLSAARVAGMKIKDAAGKPLPIMYNNLVVPPDLAEEAGKLVTTSKLTGSTDNDTNWHYGVLDVVVNPYLSDTNNWFLLDTTKSIMPLLWQEFEGPTPVYILDDQLKKKKFVDYGSDMTGRASFSDWRLIYGAIVA